MALSREEKIARAKKLREQGLTYRQIAAALGQTKSCVYKWINPEWARAHIAKDNAKRNAAKRQWERDNRAPCPKCGEPMKAGSRCESHRSALCQRCRFEELRNEREARDRLIILLWNQGRTLIEIAGRLDSTPSSIAVKVCRLRDQGYELPYRRAGASPKHPEQVAA